MKFNLFQKRNKIDIENDRDFIQDKGYVLSYLKSKDVNNASYIKFIKNNNFGILAKNVFNANNEEYSLEYFFSCSSVEGKDIINANKNIQSLLIDKNLLGIAKVLGDDIVCLDIKTGEIYLWLIETNDGEKIHIAKSFDEFINMIKFI